MIEYRTVWASGKPESPALTDDDLNFAAKFGWEVVVAEASHVVQGAWYVALFVRRVPMPERVTAKEEEKLTELGLWLMPKRKKKSNSTR